MERLLKEAPKLSFNANVFKSNCTLAITKDEIAADESQVKLLAKFLIEDQVPALLNDMKSGDGVPTDSQSLTDLMHRNGVNMRYLGRMHAMLQAPATEEQVQLKGDFKHLRHLVEREVLLRSAKHVCKQYLRDQLSHSSLHIAHAVAHLLNLILCPHPFLETLNNGTVKFQDETIQTKFHSLDECVQVAQKTEEPVLEKEEALTKKQAKKLAKKLKKEEAAPVVVKKNIEDILFQPSVETETFSITELLGNVNYAKGLNRVDLSHVFALTPKELFVQIREIAKARFGFDLGQPEAISSLSTPLCKQSLLRDLCRCLGVQLQAKPYMLSNNVKHAAAFHTEQAQAKQQQVSFKNKKAQVAAVTEAEVVLSYHYLPFNHEDVLRLFPVTK